MPKSKSNRRAKSTIAVSNNNISRIAIIAGKLNAVDGTFVSADKAIGIILDFWEKHHE